MKIAIVGGKGMLGTDLGDVCRKNGAESVILDLPEVDICNPESIAASLPACDVVINCAAFTRVDDAEKERKLAHAINADGARNVALASRVKGLRVIHISTDYIFNGRKGTPYVENDLPQPVNYYGLTKLQGEEDVRAAGGKSLIVRTQSLYGLRGRNFIKAILGQIQKGKTTLTVVNDQTSSPTYTRHLAEALFRLAKTDATGLVNVAAAGACSWFDFARAIVARVRPGIDVTPMSSSELKYPAARPPFSVLDTTRYTQLTGHSMPTWQQGLDEYLAEEPLAAALK
ncbi:MAG: dTDP-4-dehydrorhamnose reductase [bacterium]